MSLLILTSVLWCIRITLVYYFYYLNLPSIILLMDTVNRYEYAGSVSLEYLNIYFYGSSVISRIF